MPDTLAQARPHFEAALAGVRNERDEQRAIGGAGFVGHDVSEGQAAAALDTLPIAQGAAGVTPPIELTEQRAELSLTESPAARVSEHTAQAARAAYLSEGGDG